MIFNLVSMIEKFPVNISENCLMQEMPETTLTLIGLTLTNLGKM